MRKGFTLIELLIVIVVIAIIAAIAIPGLLASKRVSSERNASSSLKTIVTAEADFRSNDRDGNKIQDFWTYDVAGLYCIKTATASASAIKLIELSVASADFNPLAAPTGQYSPTISAYGLISPKAGYWFWAMNSDASATADYTEGTGGTPAVGTDHYNMARFGFLAFPDSYPADGKLAFILNERNSIFRRHMTATIKPAGGQGNDITASGYTDWPTESALRNEWSKLD